MPRFRLPCLAAALLLTAGVARADQVPNGQTPVEVTLKDHHFTPAEISLPPDTRVTLLVTNQDTTPAEFESDDFSAEKVLPSGKQVKVEVGPFKAGTYEFHDEYNEDESKSRIVVK